MKRSEAIQKLMRKVISPYEVIKKEYFDNGIYEMRAKNLLDFIENELKMQPPQYFNIDYYDEPDCDGLISEWEEE